TPQSDRHRQRDQAVLRPSRGEQTDEPAAHAHPRSSARAPGGEGRRQRGADKGARNVARERTADRVVPEQGESAQLAARAEDDAEPRSSADDERGGSGTAGELERRRGRLRPGARGDPADGRHAQHRDHPPVPAPVLRYPSGGPNGPPDEGTRAPASSSRFSKNAASTTGAPMTSHMLA